MTAPRWIAEAIEATATLITPELIEATASALIERLPMEAMAAAGCEALATASPTNPMGAALAMVSAMVLVLAEGDPEVVQLADLYQGACRALDDAGVPYAHPGQHDASGPPPLLNLADRIRWLAQQRPTRLELQRVAAERDEGRATAEADRIAGVQTADAMAAQIKELRAQLAKASDLNGKLAAGAAELEQQRDDAQAREAELRGRFSELQRQLSNAETILDARALAIAELTTEVEAARAARDEYKRQRDAAEDTIAGLRQQSTMQAARIKELSVRKVTKPPARGKKAVRR